MLGARRLLRLQMLHASSSGNTLWQTKKWPRFVLLLQQQQQHFLSPTNVILCFQFQPAIHFIRPLHLSVSPTQE